MKGCIGFSILLLCFIFTQTFSQNYYNENATSLVVKGNAKNFIFYANTLNTTINIPASTFELSMKFPVYVAANDTGFKIKLNKIIDPLMFTSWVLRCSPVEFSLLDKASSNKQVVNVQGNFLMGNISVPISIPVEFTFSDRQILFKLNFSLKMQQMGLTIPEEYKDKITGWLDFRVDQGEVILRKE